MKKHFLLITSLLFSSMVFAGGYQINLQGMRQLAMGGTGAAVPWDAATVFYNPGGMTSIRSFQAYASVNALMPSARYVDAPTGTNIVDTKPKTYTPFNVYLTTPLSYKSPISIGLGIYTPFGTGVNWGKEWVGRYIIQEVQLQTIFFQPTLSYQITDEISIGAGFVYATGSVELHRAIPTINSNGEEGQAELTGNANGVGYNIGVHIKASDDVQFGFTYRSRVNMKVKRGYARFSNVPGSMTTSFANTAFSSELPMPQVVTFGVGWHVNENLSLQAEANYVGWAAYDSLGFDYENNTALLSDTRSARRYTNTVAVRLGMHYKFDDKFAGMLGTAWDPSPVRDGYLNPDLPDANRVLATGGLSYRISERLTAIGVFEYVFSAEREGTSNEHGFTGKYKSSVINPGLAISFDF